jgi:hypothetical protein
MAVEEIPLADRAIDNWICEYFNEGEESFPCNAGPIEAVSLAIVAGGVGLLMAVFLTSKVSNIIDEGPTPSLSLPLHRRNFEIFFISHTSRTAIYTLIFFSVLSKMTAPCRPSRN